MQWKQGGVRQHPGFLRGQKEPMEVMEGKTGHICATDARNWRWCKGGRHSTPGQGRKDLIWGTREENAGGRRALEISDVETASPATAWMWA